MSCVGTEKSDYHWEKEPQEALNCTRKFERKNKLTCWLCNRIGISGAFIVLGMCRDAGSRWTLPCFPILWVVLETHSVLGWSSHSRFWWQLSGKLTLSKYVWKASSKSGFASRTSAITWLTVLLKAFSSRRWMSLSSSVSVSPSLWDSISLDSLEHLTQIFLKHYSYENTTLFQKPAKLKPQSFPHRT